MITLNIDVNPILLQLIVILFKRDKDILISFSKLDGVGQLHTVYHKKHTINESVFLSMCIRPNSAEQIKKIKSMIIEEQKVDSS